jgi:protein SCO1/2
VGIDQNLNAQVPLHLGFRDENGKPVVLGDYFRGKPVLLSLVYFNCPLLCPEVLTGMTEAMRTLKFDVGKDYDVLTVSFDPNDTPAAARKEKQEQIHKLGDPEAATNWHFLTGSESSIQALTHAVGFRYKRDPADARRQGIQVLLRG